MTHPYATRTSQPEAQRQHVHGKLLPMERPAGEPGIVAGTAYFLAPFAILVTLLWAVAG